MIFIGMKKMKHIKNQIIIVMGVSGCGKSLIAQKLATEIDAIFLEGDDFHPVENIMKMEKGIPLNDIDRQPWLAKLNQILHQSETTVVLSCSALKEIYREQLCEGFQNPPIFVHLAGTFELIYERMQARSHFMPPALLQSQFDTLEEPIEGIQISGELPPPIIVQIIVRKLQSG